MTIGVRTRVWAGTLSVVSIYAGAIDLVDATIFAPRFDLRAQSLALSFAAVQVAAILLFVVGLFARKWMVARREARSKKIRREIQEALALQSIGQDELSRLRSLLARSRRDVEASVHAALATLSGSAGERVRTAAGRLGLGLPDSAERLDAMFAEAGTANLRRRAVLVEQLEPHALILAGEHIPRALASNDRASLIAALDMLRAWKRMLTVSNIELPLRHPDPAVRVRALQAWPYVPNAPASLVGTALEDPAAEVRAAAASAAGKLRLSELTGALVDALSDPAPDVATAASFALAATPEGLASLQRVVSSGKRPAAAVAFEALEKATMGRMELA